MGQKRTAESTEPSTKRPKTDVAPLLDLSGSCSVEEATDRLTVMEQREERTFAQWPRNEGDGWNHRNQMADWILQVAAVYKWPVETQASAVQLYDRLWLRSLATQTKGPLVEREHFRCAGLAVLLASKFVQGRHPKLHTVGAATKCTNETLRQGEREILEDMGFNIVADSVWDWVHAILALVRLHLPGTLDMSTSAYATFTQCLGHYCDAVMRTATLAYYPASLTAVVAIVESFKQAHGCDACSFVTEMLDLADYGIDCEQIGPVAKMFRTVMPMLYSDKGQTSPRIITHQAESILLSIAP